MSFKLDYFKLHQSFYPQVLALACGRICRSSSSTEYLDSIIKASEVVTRYLAALAVSSFNARRNKNEKLPEIRKSLTGKLGFGDFLTVLQCISSSKGNHPLKKEFEKSFFFDEKVGDMRDRGRRLENIERHKRFTFASRILDHNANVFWHSWVFDWRGRLTVRAPILSPQKSDIDRSLIRFKEWKELGINGWKWFRIFLFNFCKEHEYHCKKKQRNCE